VLLEEAFGPLNERQLRYAQRIQEAGQRQLELIDNLVGLARFQAGDVELELGRILLVDLVRASVSGFREAAEAKGMALTMRLEADDTVIDGDVTHLGHAFRNVVSNAVRYSEESGEVSVAVTLGGKGDGTPSDSPRVLVVVADRGPGIAPDELNLILDDFDQRASMELRKERRFGRGLRLTRRIVELHGGRIWVDSEGRAGEGTRVHIELPVGAGSGTSK